MPLLERNTAKDCFKAVVLWVLPAAVTLPGLGELDVGFVVVMRHTRAPWRARRSGGGKGGGAKA